MRVEIALQGEEWGLRGNCWVRRREGVGTCWVTSFSSTTEVRNIFWCPKELLGKAGRIAATVVL